MLENEKILYHNEIEKERHTCRRKNYFKFKNKRTKAAAYNMHYRIINSKVEKDTFTVKVPEHTAKIVKCNIVNKPYRNSTIKKGSLLFKRAFIETTNETIVIPEKEYELVTRTAIPISKPYLKEEKSFPGRAFYNRNAERRLRKKIKKTLFNESYAELNEIGTAPGNYRKYL